MQIKLTGFQRDRLPILLSLCLIFWALNGNAQYSIFSTTSSPSSGVSNDGMGVEVGLKIQSSVNGTITALKYYKGSGITGTRTGHVWTLSGYLLAEVVFTGESSSGWQTIELQNPVEILADSVYVISYYSSSGDYMYTTHSFGDRVGSGFVNALASGEQGPNGVYSYDSSSIFPVNSYENSNYFVDLIFYPASINGGGLSGSGDSNYVAKFIDSTTLGNSIIYDNGLGVGVGTDQVADTAFLLFVEKGIRTRKIKVDQDNWPDYVFADNYVLQNLDSVKKYVDANKHLPGLPSAEEIATNGLNLGEGQSQLLQKIEELYLHLFRINEELRLIREENARLKEALLKKSH